MKMNEIILVAVVDGSWSLMIFHETVSCMIEAEVHLTLFAGHIGQVAGEFFAIEAAARAWWFFTMNWPMFK